MTLDKSLGVRMDDELNLAIQQAAKALGMTIQEYVRHALRRGLGLSIKPVRLHLVP